jgi:hypothetical protein
LETYISNRLNITPDLKTRNVFRLIQKHLFRISQKIHYISATHQCYLGKISLFILKTIRNTQIHSVGRMQCFSMLIHMIHIVTTGLQQFNFYGAEGKWTSLSLSSFLFNQCRLILYSSLLAILWLKQTFLFVPVFLFRHTNYKSCNLIQRRKNLYEVRTRLYGFSTEILYTFLISRRRDQGPDHHFFLELIILISGEV